MSLFLLEFASPARDAAALESFIGSIDSAVSAGEVIESQVASDFARLFVIVEHNDQATLTADLTNAGINTDDIAEVRLVGAELADVKAARQSVGYLVEWDFPAGLTMDTYLARKAAKTPLYANVPEVTFLRTYVREDMVKCLCFYNAPDEDAVRHARDVVQAPVTRLSRLAGEERVAK